MKVKIYEATFSEKAAARSVARRLGGQVRGTTVRFPWDGETRPWAVLKVQPVKGPAVVGESPNWASLKRNLFEY